MDSILSAKEFLTKRGWKIALDEQKGWTITEHPNAPAPRSSDLGGASKGVEVMGELREVENEVIAEEKAAAQAFKNKFQSLRQATWVGVQHATPDSPKNFPTVAEVNEGGAEVWTVGDRKSWTATSAGSLTAGTMILIVRSYRPPTKVERFYAASDTCLALIIDQRGGEWENQSIREGFPGTKLFVVKCNDVTPRGKDNQNRTVLEDDDMFKIQAANFSKYEAAPGAQDGLALWGEFVQKGKARRQKEKEKVTEAAGESKSPVAEAAAPAPAAEAAEVLAGESAAKFQELDTDKSGSLTVDELSALVRELGTSPGKAFVYLDKYDGNKNGLLDLKEFQTLIKEASENRADFRVDKQVVKWLRSTSDEAVFKRVDSVDSDAKVIVPLNETALTRVEFWKKKMWSKYNTLEDLQRELKPSDNDIGDV